MRVYVASPVHTALDIHNVEVIEKLLNEASVDYYSPLKSPLFGLLKNNKNQGERQSLLDAIFAEHVAEIKKADVVVAFMDSYDPCVMWELGYGYRMLSNADTCKPILVAVAFNHSCLSPVVKRSACCHVTTTKDQRELVEVLKSSNGKFDDLELFERLSEI